MNSENETGDTLHKIIKRPDAGYIVDQGKVAVSANNTALTLYKKVLKAVQELLKEKLPKLQHSITTCIAQNESKASYFG